MSGRRAKTSASSRADDYLRLLVDSQPDYAIFLLDDSGHVVTWNGGARRLKGYEADEIVGRHFSVFYPAEAVAEGVPEQILESARLTGRYEAEGWRVRKDGTTFWADVVITALRDEEGALVGFGKVTRDLTSRQLATEQLRSTATELRIANAELEQFRLLVTTVRDYAIFVLDASGVIQTWNAGAERIKGYTADEAIGRHFELFYTEAARARRHPAYELEVAAREGRFEEEGWRLRKDGTLFWANVVITALRDARGVLLGFAKVTRDLTERREAQQRLEDSERRAREEAERQRRRSAALVQVSRAIVARLELDEILQTATDAATDLTGAEFGVFERDFTETRIVRSDDIGAARPGLPEPVRSYLAVPIRTSDGTIAGGMVFGHRDAAVFDAEAEAAAASIASTAAVAIANAELLQSARREAAAREAALHQRDQVALALQRSLLPPDLPAIPGLELGAHYHAGTELVGGDFYDVFALGDDTWGLVLGDVCGSGPEAASQTALTRHTVRTAAMFDTEPVTVLMTLNHALLRSNTTRFTTATFLRLSASADRSEVTVSIGSGGHPPALIWRADGSFHESPARGPLLGVTGFPVNAFEVAHHTLAAGDTLVLYTDGLTEARAAGVLFGLEGVQTTLTRHRGASPSGVANALVDAALAHAAAPLRDDVAIVVIRVPRA
ncbi:PAS domain S-box protein [Solirubrobacter sp. CPCC 204708]|uniref:PAS domain S-box protein n=1 Tax=Solirubrobacter deserti TaxID=2282478 RepID=A0ABT4RJH9_9ACTN|nr:SpoIIE family protein phosphatase [Solirubrobacter deserti]MBE2319805.1 PAS domain S-box protein [Solirubrobacter deserti]MDA0138713.1 PAS domain S-box protein [Solirubrobacter deserti]